MGQTVLVSGKATLDFGDHDLLDDIIIGESGILSILSHMDVCDGDEIEILINIKNKAQEKS